LTPTGPSGETEWSRTLRDGNVTSRSCPGQTTAFGWTGDGRLAWVRVAGGDSVAFACDSLDRVVRRDINGAVSTNLLWEGDNLFAELSADGG
jgi:YD repeat-containing protein